MSRRHFSVPDRLLRRLTVELLGIIALKIVMLPLIWWIALASYHSKSGKRRSPVEWERLWQRCFAQYLVQPDRRIDRAGMAMRLS